jgi:hypothetical protein
MFGIVFETMVRIGYHKSIFGGRGLPFPVMMVTTCDHCGL